MAREIEIRYTDILSDERGWRGRMMLISRIEETDENFSADINLPLENYNTTPDEIKKEVFEKLKKAFIEITKWLRTQSI